MYSAITLVLLGCGLCVPSLALTMVFKMVVSENIAINDIVLNLNQTGLSIPQSSAPCSSEYFKVSYHGIVRVAKHLDREATPVIRFLAKSLSYKAFIQVKLADHNDHLPLFSKDVYFFTVSSRKAAAGTVLGTVFAVDKDIGENANLYFYTPTTHVALRVSPNGDIIAKQDLKPYVLKQLLVSVRCSDGGKAGKGFVSGVSVYVSVTL